MLQETFLQIFKQLHTYNFTGSFEGWVRTITIRTCINILHSKIGKWDNLLGSELPKNLPSTEVGYIEKSTLSEIVKHLPDGMRTIFNLYVVEGYDHAEIGEMLGISSSNSRAQLSRARKKLKAMVEQSNLF